MIPHIFPFAINHIAINIKIEISQYPAMSRTPLAYSHLFLPRGGILADLAVIVRLALYNPHTHQHQPLIITSHAQRQTKQEEEKKRKGVHHSLT